MKKLFVKFVPIWIFTLCSCLTIFAQTEFSKNIVDTTKQWNIVQSCFASGAGTHAYRITGEDTIINSKIYNRIQWSFDYDTVFHEWKNWHGIDWIREEDNKVFVYTEAYLYNEDKGEFSQDDSKEYLLYDFSLQSGDSISLCRETIFDDGDCCGGKFYVLSTDSIEIGSIKCKKMFLSRYLDDEYVEEIWIEGIGSDRGFLESAIYMLECGRHLLCVEQNGEAVYYNDSDYEEYKNTCYVHVSLEDVDNTSIKIYPTLVKDNIYVVSDNNKPMNVSFVNISGHIVKTIRTKGSKEIDISSLSSGAYNVLINNTYSKKIIKL